MLLVKDLRVRLGKFLLEVGNFKLGKGDYCLVLGPSGSGKSTFLETLIGLRKPERGRIFLAGKEITNLPPERRGITIVYQDYLLFPHLTVFENIAFGLRKGLKDKESLKREVLKVAKELGIGHLLDKKPHLLSGGEKQRVALARALVVKPKLLLLDEPLSALDPESRGRIRELIYRTVKTHSITTLHVSHDLEDLESLGERVLFLWKGKVLAEGSALELFKQPPHPKVASFLGLNTLTVRVVSTKPLKVALGSFYLRVEQFKEKPEVGAKGLLHFHPSAASFQGGENLLEGRVLKVSYERGLVRLDLSVEGQRVKLLFPSGGLERLPERGERLAFFLPPKGLFLNLELSEGENLVL